MPPLSVNDLPPALLAGNFAITHPRRDGLALLLTCRHWLGVAEAECAQHLWGAMCLNKTNPRLQQLLAGGARGKRALLAGFAKRAPKLQELEFVAPAWTRPAFNNSATLVASVPVLRNLCGGTGLHSLAVTCPFSQREFAAACKAAAQLASLRRLTFQSECSCEQLDLRPLGPLSCLALLERLEFRTFECVKHMPLDLLPALGRLACQNCRQRLGMGTVAAALPGCGSPTAPAPR